MIRYDIIRYNTVLYAIRDTRIYCIYKSESRGFLLFVFDSPVALLYVTTDHRQQYSTGYST